MKTRRLVPALALVLAASAVPGSSAISVAPPEGSPGIGDPYFPLDGNGGIDVVHYDVRDRYDFRKRRLVGVTAMAVKATEALSRFNLDLLLPVTDVFIDGERVAFKKPHQHELQITPDATIPANESFSVIVKYAGKPGPISYQGERNWLASRHEVVTMNEPHMAPWWFPSNDHPRDKATYDVRITTGRDREVISNGRQVSRKVSGQLATTHWHTAEPMASYLAFFAAGDFTIRRGSSSGIPWLLAVSRRLPDRERSASMKAMQASGKVTVWLQEELGDYPFSSTGGLVTSLSPGFALENQTRPTYPALTNDARSLVVHELAHQWFGDSVSVRGWRDIWLNEGFATYMEARYDETHDGRTTEQWLKSSYQQLNGDGGFWDMAIDDPGKNRIFSYPIYQRGGMALAALRRVIGAADFTELLQTWVSQHRFGDAITEEFTDLAEEISDDELDGFFDAWLRAHEPPAATAANGLD